MSTSTSDILVVANARTYMYGGRAACERRSGRCVAPSLATRARREGSSRCDAAFTRQPAKILHLHLHLLSIIISPLHQRVTTNTPDRCTPYRSAPYRSASHRFRPNRTFSDLYVEILNFSPLCLHAPDGQSPTHTLSQQSPKMAEHNNTEAEAAIGSGPSETHRSSLAPVDQSSVALSQPASSRSFTVSVSDDGIASGRHDLKVTATVSFSDGNNDQCYTVSVESRVGTVKQSGKPTPSLSEVPANAPSSENNVSGSEVTKWGVDKATATNEIANPPSTDGAATEGTAVVLSAAEGAATLGASVPSTTAVPEAAAVPGTAVPGAAAGPAAAAVPRAAAGPVGIAKNAAWPIGVAGVYGVARRDGVAGRGGAAGSGGFVRNDGAAGRGGAARGGARAGHRGLRSARNPLDRWSNSPAEAARLAALREQRRIERENAGEKKWTRGPTQQRIADKLENAERITFDFDAV